MIINKVHKKLKKKNASLCTNIHFTAEIICLWIFGRHG